ncbi:hypothetical protein [Celerinatantimonas diazotrophica]|uniref:Uncharacterized protein n=1 Tax=Celerinatantimonas diazotrophica TaxID=412034 RepID=A0A4R1J979_9GAMM|nr:hypothetical protein [Celerinatantimonas diazotrophica]TCK46954.1 hypothetical protein EV690_3106 [Celerinatantimonas diazotrophica]CAG9295722.1 hypothetical protein CEDIAZO_00848 [Celerinatantimonas diazotrophica]
MMRITKTLQLALLLVLVTGQALAADDVKISSLPADDLNFSDCPSDAFTLSSLNAHALDQPLTQAAIAQIKRSGALLVSNLSSAKTSSQMKILRQQLGAHWKLQLSRIENGFQSAMLFRPTKFQAVGTFNQSSGTSSNVWVILAQANGQSLALISTIHGPYSSNLLVQQKTAAQRHQVILAGQLPPLKLVHHYQYQQQKSKLSLLSRGLTVCATDEFPLAHNHYLQWLSITFGS